MGFQLVRPSQRYLKINNENKSKLTKSENPNKIEFKYKKPLEIS